MTANWIDLDGADNVRDLGGLPTFDGRQVRTGRLIRSDSLQELTPADVRRLVDDLKVRAVADLRTGTEVADDGPGPMTREPSVRIENLSLYPEAGVSTDLAAADSAALSEHGDDPVLLPWQDDDGPAPSSGERHQARRGASSVYLRYLDDRPDSIIEALRLIAHTDGTTVVHCAAGKDRTGVVIAMALREVGVLPEEIAADYALTAERLDAVMRRLSRRPAYAHDLAMTDPDAHRPRAATMEKVLAAIDELHGGVPAWLRGNGWTEHDAEALHRTLLA